MKCLFYRIFFTTTAAWYTRGRSIVLLYLNGNIYWHGINHGKYALQRGTCISCIYTALSTVLQLFYDIDICGLFYILVLWVQCQNKNRTHNSVFNIFWLMTYIICFAYKLHHGNQRGKWIFIIWILWYFILGHYQNKNFTHNILLTLFWLVIYIICFAYQFFDVIIFIVE